MKLLISKQFGIKRDCLYILIYIYQYIPVTGLPAASEAKALNKRAVYCCITSSESSNISSTNFCKSDTM